MKAARILDYHKPLVFEDIAVPDIQADEVLVKVAACGMCRSDVLLVDGSRGQSRTSAVLFQKPRAWRTATM